MALDATAAAMRPALLDLPGIFHWRVAVVTLLLPRSSRHIVRFVNLSVASWRSRRSVRRSHAQYDILRPRLIDPVCPVVTGQVGRDGELQRGPCFRAPAVYRLPYRALFSLSMRETATRLIDALALCSCACTSSASTGATSPIPNHLFRRDAGGSSPPTWWTRQSRRLLKADPGQREYDVDLARTNIGSLADLQAGGYFTMDADD